MIELAAESLEIKRAKIEEYTEQGLYPYSRFYLDGIKQRQGAYWANHFSTIGLIGMHEACQNFLGQGIETSAGRQFAIDTLEFMRDTILDIQERTGNLYNLEATPGEGASYRLAKVDAALGQRTSGTNAAPYYTNSTQLPVNHTDDIFEALEHQDDLQTLYTGGTVLHLYLGEQIEWKAARAIVRKVCESYHLPYISLTPTFSICPEHKYLAGNVLTCPHCGAECEVYSRVVGYLRPVAGWNVGKRQEFAERQAFVIR
jgi:ribonucleoside-triphosphate reductase